MAATDNLTFQEFDDAAKLLAANPDATTVNISDPDDSGGKKKGWQSREEEEDLLGNEDSDKTELLAGQKKIAPFWTFEYYQTFFDVDTYQKCSRINLLALSQWELTTYSDVADSYWLDVLDRIKGSVLPIPGRNFVRLYVRSNPDLYGPIWICATLIFTITISGNFSNFLLHRGEPQYHYVPEFRKVSIAATAIYAYAWLVPLILWGFLSWRHSKVMSMVSYSFLEIVCVYGYSLFIYIPTSVLWIIHSEILRWVLMSLAMCLSGAVLMLTFWPAVREDNRKIAISTLVAIMLLHVLLAVGCGEYFFDQPENEKVLHPVTSIISTTKGAVQSH